MAQDSSKYFSLILVWLKFCLSNVCTSKSFKIEGAKIYKNMPQAIRDLDVGNVTHRGMVKRWAVEGKGAEINTNWIDAYRFCKEKANMKVYSLKIAMLN